MIAGVFYKITEVISLNVINRNTLGVNDLMYNDMHPVTGKQLS